MSAEVKPGYKLTDIGVIPEDWEYFTIEELVSAGVIEKPMDGNHGNIHPKSSDFVSDGIPFVMANNLKNGKIDLAGCSFIRKSQADTLQKGFSKPGDVLITHKATIGEVAIVGEINTDYIMLTPQVTYYRTANPNRLNKHYLSYFFRSDPFQRILKSMSGGGTRSYIGITAQRELPLILPPLDDQSGIAENLSSIDSFLNSLDQLIAKKRDIRQAAMQQLLTGQLRLPGFSGEWEVKRLGEIGEISGAGVDKKIRTEETEVKLLNYTDVYKKDFLRSSDFSHVVTAKPEQISRCGIKKRDVFFTPTSETRDDIGHAAVSCEDMPGIVYSYHVVRLRPTMELNTEFLGFVFKSKAFKDQASTLCEGSGTRYVITLPKFRAMKIFLPSDVSEQAEIGGILFEMSRELLALEARRDKARMLKQGMMQELLTGRIRLTNQGI